MRQLTKSILSVLLFSFSLVVFSQSGAIRINQVGYYPTGNKVAIVAFTNASIFEVVSVPDNFVEFAGTMSSQIFWKESGDTVKKADFSPLTKPGIYKIRIPGFGESYPFEISNTILRKPAYASLKSFYYQRCSYDLTAPFAGLWKRAAGHPDMQCTMHSSSGKTGKMSSPSGWYDAGDYGKYVINAGISVGTMLSFYENFNTFFADGILKIPESGNGKDELLDEVKYELDWLKTMQDNDGKVFVKLTTLSFPGMNVMPAADKGERFVIGISTAAALDFAAMMAMAGRIYSDYDAVYAADCIVRAEKAWIWAKANPAIYFSNPPDVSTGEYGDKNVTDEFLWAAAELYITTKKDEYKTYLEGKSSSLKYTGTPSWQNVQGLAPLSLSTRPNGLSASLQTTIKNSIISTADTWLNQISSSPCRIPTFNYGWGCNSAIANQGVGLLYAYILTKDTKYIKGAAECADYLLGKNATGFSFVSAYGSKVPMNFHHRPSASDGIPQPVPGFVSGGPNPGKQDNQKYPFSEPAKCFIDHVDSYASNEVCINWNSPMTALFAGVDAVMGDQSAVDFEVQTVINNPPTLALTSPAYDAKIASDQKLAIKSTATDPDGISKVELYIDSRYSGTLLAAPFQWTFDALSKGSHTVSVLAFDSKGLSYDKTNAFSVFVMNSIPGNIEAEDYSGMSGITTQTSMDNGGGLYVTSIESKDWMDYSLDILKSGKYKVNYRIASASGKGEFELRKTTGTVLSKQTVNSTGGGQKWIKQSDTINLASGKQTLRLYATAGGWNINWLNLEYIHPTAISDLSQTSDKNSINISPNPVNSDFRVIYQLEELVPFEFIMYDMKGNVISKKKIGNPEKLCGELFWSLEDKLASGEYLVCIIQKGKRLAESKLIKF